MVFGVHKIFNAFDFRNSERGSMTLPFVTVFALVGVAGVGYLVDRSTNISKTAKLNERRDQGSLTPVNAAIIAKALISAPQPAQWNTAALVKYKTLVPNLYPDPYISSVDVISGKSAQGALTIFNDPQANSAWSKSDFISNGVINTFSTDGNRVELAEINALFNAGAAGLPSIANDLKLTKTKSSVVYTLKNCTPTGVPDSKWTGYYCAQADIKSENYSRESGTPELNDSKILLGLVPPPPQPDCIIDSNPVTLERGKSVSIPVQATGVVTGYTFMAKATVGGKNLSIASDDKTNILTKANHLLGTGDVAKFTVDTSKYNQKNLPDGTKIVVTTFLKGITGTTQCANKTITVVSPVACNLAFYDYSVHATPKVGSKITKAHENSYLMARISLSNTASGDAARLQFSGLTYVDSGYTGDANGIIIPISPAVHDVRVTAQSNFGAVGTIWRGGKPIAKCVSPSGSLLGRWIDSIGGQNCQSVCGAQGYVNKFDKNGMSCLSGENFYNQSYAAKKNGSNNPYFATLTDLQNVVKGVFQTWGGGTGDFEYLRYKYPSLNRKTLNEGNLCYWMNGTNTTFGGCPAGKDANLDSAACQKQDNDNGSNGKNATDVVRACYCGGN